MSAERDLADYRALRDAILHALLDERETETLPAHLLEEAVAAAEWGRIDPDRRFWALGHAAGEAVDFEGAQQEVNASWDQLEEAVRASLRKRVLDWVRK